jgi:hypothetical protein
LKRARVTLVFSAIAFGAGSLAFAWPGIYSRYRADDFCFAAAVQKYGWANAQLVMYQTWAGTYARMLVVSIVQLFGPYVTTALPWLAIIAWVLAMGWLIVQACNLAGIRPAGLVAWTAAPMVIFFTLLEAPNRFQILYWLLGHVTYTTPLIFLTVLAGILLAAIRKSGENQIKLLTLLAIAALAFVSGGFSETAAAFQAGVFGLGLASTWLFVKKQRKPALSLVVAGLAGSLLAICVIVAAPGNRIRQATLPNPPPLVTVLELSLIYAWDFLRTTLKALPVPSALSVVIPFLIAFLIRAGKDARPTHLWLKFGYPLATCYLLVVSCVAPSVFALSAYPEARSLTAATFTLVLCLAAVGFNAGMVLRPYLEKSLAERSPWLALAASILFIIVSLYPLRASLLTLNQTLPVMARSAQLWDQRHQELLKAHAQGMQEISVAALDSQSGVMELGADPQLWVNRCAADYYGLKSIAATDQGGK